MLTCSLNPEAKRNAIPVVARSARVFPGAGMDATQLGGRLRLRGGGMCDMDAV